jgi:hypothetical protein
MTRLYAYAAAFGALITAIFGLWFGGRQSGKAAAKTETAAKAAKDTLTAIEVRNETDSKSDSDVHGALSEWMRDK